MKVQSVRSIWITALFMAVFVMAFPGHLVCKTGKPGKSASGLKPISAAKASKKIQAEQPPKASQGGQNPLQCDARAAVLMDGLTGQVLYEQNPTLRIPPASFVKVMTLYLVYDAIRAGQLKMDEMVTVSEKAWRRAWKTDSSAMFIKVGDRVKVEDLIKGIAIASGNDACVVLAEHLAGSEETFVSKMNEKAKALGLNDSQFRNSDGLPAEGQYVSALDMATLSRRYIEDHPESLAIHSTTEFEYNGIRQGNRNVLLYKNIGVDGLKTGFIQESGYHLVATGKRDGQRMIAVVMGCEKMKIRGPEAQKLLEHGFRNFSTVEAVKKDAPFGPVKVKRGKIDTLVLSAVDNARVTVGKGKEKSILVTPQLPAFVVAPVRKGQVLAKVLVQNEGKVVKEINLIASSAIEKSFLHSLLSSWALIALIVVGLAVIGFGGFWWIRRRKY